MMELNKIHCETNLETLARMPDGFLHCVVTSPPYFGLRDYGTATWEGESAECDHISRPNVSVKSQTNNGALRDNPYKSQCGKCGAVRIDQQIGLETTPAEYVAKIVEVFEEIRRALRPDGTVWINMGDSFFNTQNNNRNGVTGSLGGDVRGGGEYSTQKRNSGDWKLKPKDLCGMPWRVAFALQAAGWYLRQDIIWAKPNPMPESVTDRCTKAHEYIFLLTKSARYFYDAEAIRDFSTDLEYRTKGRVRPNGVTGFDQKGFEIRGGLHLQIGGREFRNKRSVWTVSTLPYSEAHFATFPPKLIEPCILAGCPAGGVVYDPFMGAGTTALVAHKLGRQFIGSEINAEYVAMANKRLAPHLAQGGLF